MGFSESCSFLNFLEDKFKFQELVSQIDFIIFPPLSEFSSLYVINFLLLLLFFNIDCHLKDDGKIISFPDHEF